MKTTVELPDPLFRRIKSAAAQDGKTLKEFFCEALSDGLRRRTAGHSPVKPWEFAFGGLKDLHRENRRLDRVIAAEFEQIDEEEWR